MTICEKREGEINALLLLVGRFSNHILLNLPGLDVREVKAEGSLLTDYGSYKRRLL